MFLNKEGVFVRFLRLMSRKMLALVCVCLLTVVAAVCFAEAYIIWDGSRTGEVPASFEEGPPLFLYPTDSDPVPEYTWEPETTIPDPPRIETEIEWTVVQEGPGQPWHVVPGWMEAVAA